MNKTINQSQPHNPYIGPRPFQPGELLYGRDQEIYDLLDLLIAERIVLLYSPSGAGKTSLIQAGLLPELEDEGFQALPVMRVSLEPPPEVCRELGEHNRYVLSLLLSLEEGVPKERHVPLNELAGLTFAEYLARRSDGIPGKFVLIFDQFEEILTVNLTDHDAKVEFFTQVGAALRHRDYWALFSMREEFPARLDPYLRHVPTRLSNRFRLELLDAESAVAAIQEPVQQIGVSFTTHATTKLVDDLRRVRMQQPNGMIAELPGMYVEPVQLQVVCHRLWNHLPNDIADIREADIHAAGDVDTALAGYYAERVGDIAERTGVSERTIREWFLHHLITDLGIRGQLVKEPEETQGLSNAAIEQLEDAHLVRAEQRRGVTWYELAHDRLIEPIQLDNFDWIQDHLSTLQREAALWELQERAGGLLLLDDALNEVEQWAAVHAGELTETEHEFLQACRAEQQRVRRERVKSRFIRGLAIAATIVMCLAVFFYINAETRRKEAQRLSYVSLAQNLINTTTLQQHDDLKLLLLRQAYLFNRQGRGKVLSQIDSLVRKEFEAPIFARMQPIGQEIMAVAISADGQYLACGTAGGTILVFDMHAPATAPIMLTGHSGPVCGLAFHPEGRFLASAGWDRTIRLWEPPFSDTTPMVLYGHSLGVFSVVFSPDGNRLASGSWDSTVRLWDIRNLQQSAQILDAHEAGVNAVAFSPDGALLASGGSDRTIRLWNMTALDNPPAVLPFQQSERLSTPRNAPERTAPGLPPGGDPGQSPPGNAPPPPASKQSARQPNSIPEVNALAFSPDGERLAAGTSAPTIWVWDVQNLRQTPTLFEGHRGQVLTLAFSPDGNTLASGSEDRDIRLWNLQDHDAAPHVLHGHDAMVFALTFSPNGEFLMSGSDDKTLRVWELQVSNSSLKKLSVFSAEHRAADQDSVFLQEEQETSETNTPLLDSRGIQELAFSQDAQTLYTVNHDIDIVTWNLDDALPAEWFSGNLKRKATAYAFSADAKQLAVGDDRGSVYVWRLDQSALFPQELVGHTGSVDALAFHPDGTLLASGGENRTIRVWDLRHPQPPVHVLHGHEGAISSLAFSPSQPILASGGTDTTIRLWNLLLSDNDNYPPLLFAGHSGELLSLAFAPDGKLLASADNDNELRFWSLPNIRTDMVWLLQSSPTPTLLSEDKDLLSLAFSPDGSFLAVKKIDEIHVWDINHLEADPVTLAQRIPPPQPDSSPQAGMGQAPEERPPGPQGSSSQALAFSPDGAILASGTLDGVVLWTLTDAMLDEVCQRVWRNVTLEEWQQFVGNGAYERNLYEPTCPDLP